MKNNKFLITILAASLSFTATSCSNDYLDVNDNPNAIQAEQITPELMLMALSAKHIELKLEL